MFTLSSCLLLWLSILHGVYLSFTLAVYLSHCLMSFTLAVYLSHCLYVLCAGCSSFKLSSCLLLWLSIVHIVFLVFTLAVYLSHCLHVFYSGCLSITLSSCLLIWLYIFHIVFLSFNLYVSLPLCLSFGTLVSLSFILSPFNFCLSLLVGYSLLLCLPLFYFVSLFSSVFFSFFYHSFIWSLSHSFSFIIFLSFPLSLLLTQNYCDYAETDCYFFRKFWKSMYPTRPCIPRSLCLLIGQFFLETTLLYAIVGHNSLRQAFPQGCNCVLIWPIAQKLIFPQKICQLHRS